MNTLYELSGTREESKFPLYGFFETKRILPAQQELSLRTYFNAFYPKDWEELTYLQNVSIFFQGKGEGKLQLYGIQHEGKFYTEKLLGEHDFQEDVQLNLSFPSDWKAYSLIYPKIVSETTVKDFQLAYQTSDIPNLNSFHIGIVICTYNKQNYLSKTLERLSKFQSDALRLSICAVDNAQNLDSNLFQKYPNATLLPNKNYGGSGGFTRGMLYFAEQEDVTHVLLMDDDIELDERIFQRLENILKFQKNSKQVISGTMLDALKPTYIYETSAKIAYNKLRYEPNNFLLDVTKTKNLLQISKKEEMEYAAWWFMLFPKELLLKIGYSFPFFIRGDDIEYSQRLKNSGYSIYRMNGVAIWHEPFYAKDPIWIHYYTIRNLFIHFALYPKKGKFLRFLRLWMIYGSKVTNYHYIFLELILNGLKDYLKGPEFLQNLKSDEFHKHLVNSTRTDTDFQEEKFDFVTGELTKASFFKRRILAPLSLFTGNLFFLPPFKSRVQILGEKFLNRFGLTFGAREIEEYSDIRKEKRTFRKNPKRAIRIFLDYLITTFRYLLFSSKIEKKWRESHKKLVSKEFWEDYLEIKRDNLKTSNRELFNLGTKNNS